MLKEIKGLSVWPISNIIRMSNIKDNQKYELKPKTKPYHQSIIQWVQTFLAMVPVIGLTYICLLIQPLQDQLKQTRQGNLISCALKIIMRDLILMLVLAGSWQWYLYSSPCSKRMQSRKFNPEYPSNEQLRRNYIYSTSTTLIGSAFQIILLYLWTHGYITNYYTEILSHPLASAFWIIGMPIWRDLHFFIVHRMMHPWRLKNVPDIGRILYNCSHSLHHKDQNFSVWSGISMHPIEGFFYESANIVPCFFMHHPSVILICKIHLSLMAMWGHDGYDSPGQGHYFHYLHHTRFDCNYGSENSPLDWLFGSYCDGSDDDYEVQSEKGEKSD